MPVALNISRVSLEPQDSNKIKLGHFQKWNPTRELVRFCERFGSVAVTYAAERRFVAADLRIRTIAPLATIASQSATYHGSIHSIKACPAATHTNTAAPVIAQRTRPSVIVAIISLPFAANATTEPTNIDAMMCAIASPYVVKNK
jgi:hypothetical protein